VAHCFGDVVREVAGRLEDGRWPVVNEIIAKHGVTQDQLGQACEAFCKFVASSTEIPKERMNESLARCGWFDVPEVAQVAYMAYLGTVMSGYFFAGVREATLQGVGPALTCQDLREAGARAARLMTVPRWRRRLTAAAFRVSLAWRAFRGG
jgi:hypothetical protein